MKDNFFDSKKRDNRQTYAVKPAGVDFMVGNFNKKTKKRLRGRTPDTFNHKLTKIKSQYNKLFKKSQKSKEEFNQIEEESQGKILKNISQKRTEPKPFFCVKYPTFDEFIKVQNLKSVGTVERASKKKSYI